VVPPYGRQFQKSRGHVQCMPKGANMDARVQQCGLGVQEAAQLKACMLGQTT